MPRNKIFFFKINASRFKSELTIKRFTANYFTRKNRVGEYAIFSNDQHKF